MHNFEIKQQRKNTNIKHLCNFDISIAAFFLVNEHKYIPELFRFSSSYCTAVFVQFTSQLMIQNVLIENRTAISCSVCFLNFGTHRGLRIYISASIVSTSLTENIHTLGYIWKCMHTSSFNQFIIEIKRKKTIPCHGLHLCQIWMDLQRFWHT